MPSIAIGIALVAGAAASAYGSSQQAGAAKDAAGMQYQASQQAAAMQWAMFQQMQGNLSPYMVTGQNALNNLGWLTGQSPMPSPQVQQWQQQLQSAQSALSALGVAPGGTAGPAMTPGMQAAMAYDPNSSGSHSSIAASVIGTSNNPLSGWFDDILGQGNRSAIGDIYGALQAGNPISDASWAAAGFGPGGAALSGSPQTNSLGVPGVAGAGATGTAGAPAGATNLGLVNATGGGPVGTIAGATMGGAAPTAAAGAGTSTPGTLPTDAAGLQSLIANLKQQINQANFSATPGNPLTAPLTAPFKPTMAQLEATPGYQFTLNQGLKAVQNSATAQGLGQSGPALAGAADYAAGLASQTYQQNFSNYWSNNMNLYNMVSGLATMGQNAAAGVGTAGIHTAGAAGNLLTGGASALGAGQIGAANAWAGGLNSIAGAGSNAAMLYAMNQNGLFGGAGAAQTIAPLPPGNDASLWGASGYA